MLINFTGRCSRFHHRRRWFVIAIFATLLACQSEDPQREAPDELQAEVDTEAATSPGDGEVDCPGLDVDDPLTGRARLVRGQVFAPQGRLADVWQPWWSPPVQFAHAEPGQGEEIVAGARVWLTEADDRGEPDGEILRETTTNDSGRWCLHVPEDIRFGPALLVIAEGDEERLRRPVLQPTTVDIYARPEALLRLLIEEGHHLTELDTATYIHLDVSAQSVVDQSSELVPRPGAGLASYLDRLKETMGDDRALRQAIDEALSADIADE